MAKSKLDTLLDEKPGAGELRKPRGVTLSTDLAEQRESALVHKSTNALMHSGKLTTSNPRPAKGYKIRTDIREAYKLLAAQHKRKLYLEMEEALLKHLKEYGIDLPRNS